VSTNTLSDEKVMKIRDNPVEETTGIVVLMDDDLKGTSLLCAVGIKSHLQTVALSHPKVKEAYE